MVYGGWDYLSFIQLFLHVLATFLVFYHLLSTSTYLNYQVDFRVSCVPRVFWNFGSPLQTTAAGACMFVFLVEDDPSVWEPKDGQPDQGYVNVYRGVDFLRANTWPRVWWFCDADVGCISGRTACRHVDFHLISWTGRLPPKRVREPDYPDANRWKKISWLASMGVASGHGRTFTPQKIDGECWSSTALEGVTRICVVIQMSPGVLQYNCFCLPQQKVGRNEDQLKQPLKTDKIPFSPSCFLHPKSKRHSFSLQLHRGVCVANLWSQCGSHPVALRVAHWSRPFLSNWRCGSSRALLIEIVIFSEGIQPVDIEYISNHYDDHSIGPIYKNRCI